MRIGVELDDALLTEAPARYLPPTTPLRRDGAPVLAV
jgi:hypothetical protein